jgi:hypothetical protein
MVRHSPGAAAFARGIVPVIDPFLGAYCLGLIVGEGSFTDHGRAPALAVKLHEDDPEPLEALRQAFGGAIYGPYSHNGRRYRMWTLRGRLLEAAVPYFFQYLPPCKKRRQFEQWLERWWWHLERRSWRFLEGAALSTRSAP